MYHLLLVLFISLSGFSQPEEMPELPIGSLLKFDIKAIRNHCPDFIDGRRKFYFVEGEIKCTPPLLHQYCVADFHKDNLSEQGLMNCRVYSRSILVGEVSINFSTDPCPALFCTRGILDFREGFPIKRMKENLGRFVSVYDERTFSRKGISNDSRDSGKVKGFFERAKETVNQINGVSQ